MRNEVVARGSARGPREVAVDGAPLPRLADLLGRFPTVHFSVEDVASLNGAPSGRRRFLDVALCQLEPAYVGHLRDYTAALRQRNRMLAERAEMDGNEFSAWEAILARSGAELDRRREELTVESDRVLRGLAEGLDSTLRPGLEYSGMDGTTDEEGVAQRAERLESLRFRDRRLGWTSEGPHRAAVGCRIGGSELNYGASRGMSRLYSILLRLALARVLDARLEEPPVVFLDDPESELDPRWIGRLLELVPESSQAIVTACRPLSVIPARFRRIQIETLAVGSKGPAPSPATAQAGAA